MANPSAFGGRPRISLQLNHQVSGTTISWQLYAIETLSQPSFNLAGGNAWSVNFNALGGGVPSGTWTYDFRPTGNQTKTIATGSFVATAAGSWSATANGNTPIGSASVDGFIQPNFPPPPTPSWSTGTTLTSATRATAYSATVAASPVTSYSVVGQSADTRGLSASSNTISGTPTSVGTVTFTIRANNSGSTADRTFSILINPALPTYSDSTVVATASVGTAYSDAVAASETASYSIFSGALPGGLTLNTTTGAITGTPNTPGVFNFVIRATNVTGTRNTGTLTITVTSGARVWNGTSFVSGTTRAWNGTAYVSTTTRVWSGTAWTTAT